MTVVHSDMVSLAGLKKLAAFHLKANSRLRSLILSEPDTLPRQEALAKIEIFSKLLEDELKP